MPWPLTDPIDIVRRALSRAEAALLDRALSAVAGAAESAIVRPIRSLQQQATDMMAMLARLPHNLANQVADAHRGFHSRPLTSGEMRASTDAHGFRVNPYVVRIVRGPGLSAFAKAAFIKGNPAITIGNTIYIKADYDVNHPDLSATPKGAELMVHEFTHVVQYATLGFARFGVRYAEELARHNGNPDALYDHRHRKLSYGAETLEAQAEMAGNFGRVRGSPNPQAQALAATLRHKMRGTGVYGQ